MAVLASFTNETEYESEDIAIDTGGLVQVLVRGDFGLRGVVRLLLKGADGGFHPYSELTFRGYNSAVEVSLLAGDVVRLQAQHCLSVSAEIRQ